MIRTLSTNLFKTALVSSLLAATPALATPQDGGVQMRSTMSLASRNADGTSFEVRVEDGAVRSLKIDGRDVPTDRARVTDDGVEVLDDNGEVIHRFAVRMGGMIAPAVAEPRVRVRPAVPGGVQVQAFDGQEMPRAPKQVATASAKSMIGAGFGEVDEAVVHHLKVDPSKATMITSIVDGLPAQKAGLERFDVIVGVDGKAVAGMDALRRMIAGAEPGSKMKLSVRRGAETKEIEIETAAFDGDKLVGIDGIRWQGGAEDFLEMDVGENGGAMMFFIGPDGKRRELRVPSVRGLQMPQPDWLDPRQFEGMEQAIREMVERTLRDAGIDENGAVDVRPEAGGGVEKPAPKRGVDSADERLRRMEERMEDLRRELERERAARGGQKPADA